MSTILDLIAAADELRDAALAKAEADDRFRFAAAEVADLIEALSADPRTAGRVAALSDVHERLRGVAGTGPAPRTNEEGSVSTPLDDIISAIDADTNEIAAVVADLRGRVTTGMSQADVDSVKSALTAIEGRLKGIASDPNNPAPGAAPRRRP